MAPHLLTDASGYRCTCSTLMLALPCLSRWRTTIDFSQKQKLDPTMADFVPKEELSALVMTHATRPRCSRTPP